MELLKKLSLAFALLMSMAIPASASVIVNYPGPGAQVSSPFALSANAISCSSQNVAAMGFSLDSSTNTTTVNGTSVNAQIAASVGAHTLHVKAWGAQGAVCVSDVAITVNSVTSTVPAVAATNAVSVSSPAAGSTVGSPFSLSASAAYCSSQAVSAMGYSLDSSTSTAVVISMSVNASVTAAAGAHTLHVKAWGNQGSACDTDVAITVAASVTAAPAAGVSVSVPTIGAVVTSPFGLTASAPTCQSQAVSAMGYSLDNSTYTATFNGTSVQTTVQAALGIHTLHVKAWGNQGSACNTDVPITVGVSAVAATSVIPGTAVSISSIQALNNWSAINDSTAGGSSTGITSLVGTPAQSGNARRFLTSYQDYGAELYDAVFGDDTNATHFFYDGWVYMASPSNAIANVEMDLNQVMPNGQTVIFGFQCDGWSGTWDYTANKGTPQVPIDEWVHSAAYCNPRDWSTNNWHHVQVYYFRDGVGNVTYSSVWLDGLRSDINATVPSAFALGWGPTLLTNFQIDGEFASSGSSTVYLDNLKISRW